MTDQDQPSAGLREQLAALAHEQWSGWMHYMLPKMLFRDSYWTERWRRQMDTPYDDLSEEEKESDRREADRVLACVAKAGEGE